MAEHGRRAASGTARVSASVALVLALAGLLFTVNARVSGDRAQRESGDLAQLVAFETETVAQLTTELDELRREVDTLTAELGAEDPPGDPALAELTALAAGRVAVAGPGLTVVLSDAPSDTAPPPGIHPDDLVVHQQDLEAVMNALWAGGAEAMSVQDQRITTTSAIRCVGNVLLLHGQVYSPPYVVRALGDPIELRAALDASAAVQVYREWADAVGLGWSVAVGSVELPAYDGAGDLHFARVHGAAAPGEAVPDEAVPDEAVLDESVPSEVVS